MNKDIAEYINITQYNSSMYIEGNTDILVKLVEKHNNDYNWGLQSACRGGCMYNVDLMISKGGCGWNNGLYGACRGGHMNIVCMMISKGASDWDWGLKGACLGGHKKIAELMILMGANDLDTGFYYACEGGHMNIVEFLIKKGVNFLNQGLIGAYEGGQTHMIEYLESKGAVSDIIAKYSFPLCNKKTKYFHNDLYRPRKEFMKFSILYWTIVYQEYIGREAVQKDLILELLKILYF